MIQIKPLISFTFKSRLFLGLTAAQADDTKKSKIEQLVSGSEFTYGYPHCESH
ncbi:hypothetical protein PQO01_03385 [Lentisphaera marina]|uniref:hypothetical protein n=1 Tax=Lentisphaera marina TaxID=1111041 RepID=UPI00236566AD|nr:hypothetical protein [Lentisphaera marina]MDD7983993.1 hypothetical protein [Lentisphaera marina]